MSRSVLRATRSARLLMPAAALLVSLAMAGCGGGGGGSSSTNPGSGSGNNPSGPPGTPAPIGSSNLANITGTVTDTSGAPVNGAAITIKGTALSGSSGSDGKFTIYNVPLTSTTFTVTAPTGGTYYNTASYNGAQYNLVTPCPLPLPTLAAGADPLPYTITMYPSQNPPPPPPTNGGACP